MLNVGINGFGRIGRAIFRINERAPRFRVVAVNDLDPNVENHAYLLRYDSIYGRFDGQVGASNGDMHMFVNGRHIQFYATSDISEVPWTEHEVDVVIDATGVHQNVLSSHRLVESGAVRKVIITHSPKDSVDHTIIFGVNETSYDPMVHHVVSTSICDANAVAPVLRLLDEAYGVEHGYITTLHPWLAYQNLIDGSVRSVSSPGHFWKDFSLGRASTMSLIPKNTTLVDALQRVMPELAARLDAISFRVPTGIVSASDVTLTLHRQATAEDLNALLRAGAGHNARIIGYQEDYLVSIDFLGIEQSVFVDGRWTRANGKKGIKLVLWYDNEWGYSQRVVDMVDLIARHIEITPVEQEAPTPFPS